MSGDDAEQPGRGYQTGEQPRRRVIHWNPEEGGGGDGGGGPGRRVGGAFAIGSILLVAAVYGVIKFVPWDDALAPADGPEGGAGEAGAGAADALETEEDRLNKYRFVSEAKLEEARSALKARLEAARRRTDETPLLIAKLVEIEEVVEQGENYVGSSDLPRAMERFDHAGSLVTGYEGLLDDKANANAAYDKFVAKIDAMDYLRDRDPPLYEQAAGRGARGSERIQEGKFADAIPHFEHALGLLTGYEEKIKQELEAKEATATEALSKGDQETAVKLLKEILEIEPDNARVQLRLQRAEVLDRVFPLLQSAAEKEQKGDLEGALKDFDQAFATDPRSPTAQQGKHRVARLIRERDFNRLMAEAAGLEKKGQFDPARAKYEEAGKVDPKQAEAVKQALAQNKLKKRAALVTTGIAHARRAESNHQWAEARDAYETVLALEPNHKEAYEGLIYVGQIERSLIGYNQLIKEAFAHEGRGDYQKAIASLNAAMESKPSYLAKTFDVQGLESRLKLQGNPVVVTLTSDGKTRVRVRGHKNLDQFKEHAESFLPGNYTLVGTRTRYRDVELKVNIRNGQANGPFHIVCTERVQ